MKIVSLVLFFSFSYLAAYTKCFDHREKNYLRDLLMARDSKKIQSNYHITEDHIDHVSNEISKPIYVASQKGRKEADKIDKLLGQPDVKFSQYSGYVTVDPKAGRALFYYFAEAAEASSTKPLVLWLNGEMVANVLFLESPAGVGFSYSNKSSDYVTGDNQTALDSYTFLLNWLERFPEYKTRDFFLTGESYAGHYVPQLAQLILQNNKNTNHTIINLKGIAIGNAYIDFKDRWSGTFDHFWTSALISEETHYGIKTNCNFSSPDAVSKDCVAYTNRAVTEAGNIDIYNIYAPLCHPSSTAPPPSISRFDPCSKHYVFTYLNKPEAQEALHANTTRSLPGPWQGCNDPMRANWTGDPDESMLPMIKNLMASGNISILIYSGDVDGIISVTTTMYSMARLGAPVKTPWYPWYSNGEVGGYAVGYENVTVVTVRGAGHLVPSYQPKRALALFSSFLQGKLPPRDTNLNTN
ncbi:hypothetical protein CASFOL_042264 [Castilleja foliolosa]|uniref:Carboxypeptidase n=1 Tax=Castilleja foliolosa TaxID=1961234 RepID=A0ABD3B9Z1_9LAMI